MAGVCDDAQTQVTHTAIREVERCERGELKIEETDLGYFEQLVKLATVGIETKLSGETLDTKQAIFAREVGNKEIARMYAEARKTAGDRVPLGVLWRLLPYYENVMEPDIYKDLRRLLEFHLRQGGSLNMDRYGMALAFKWLEKMPVEERKKWLPKEQLECLSVEERELLLAKDLKLPLTDDSPLWGIVSKIAFQAKRRCAVGAHRMRDGYKAGKKEEQEQHQHLTPGGENR
jgi:hypothetical protein